MNAIRFYDFQDNLNKLSKFFNSTCDTDCSTLATSEWAPRADIKETKEQFIVLLDLPGVERDAIKITMEDGILNISGERQTEVVEKKENYYRSERTMGKFSRRFSLPDSVDSNNIAAKLVNGVLEISIPKSEKSKPRTIAIES